MRLQFKIQPFQTDAVMSVVNVFKGQPAQVAGYRRDLGKNAYNEDGAQQARIFVNDEGYKNADIMLSDDDLLTNLQKVQDTAGIKRSATLYRSRGSTSRCSLDIEMETGTGKTYVYIKTMFELKERYGWSKYIVVVPSIAIREGVKKSFEITADHFMSQYGKKARFFIYNSSNLQQIDAYSSSEDLYVMIINVQAFNSAFKEGSRDKAARIIFDKRDEFGSRRPIDVISANRPIIILDEPQKMGGEKTQKGISQFRPLFTLNYSATHKETHNPVYRLDALDAFNKKLVKKIEVIGFDLHNLKGTDRYVYLDSIIVSPDKKPQARLTFERQLDGGMVKHITKKMEVGDSLYAASNNMPEYKGFTISDIRPLDNSIEFANGVTLHINEAKGDITADIKARIQIRQTINAHLRKERELFKKGIKVLSLFFIDEVKNYREYDDEGHQITGRYGKMFEEEYEDAIKESQDLFEPEYSAYLRNISATETHAGYFSIDKKGHSVNSSTKRGSDISDDISAYDLIMKNKELLLSYKSNVRFIFSHSALREGWDNPNVFQICSLKQSNSSVQKRQEVGRGLRLCVNQQGARMDSDNLGDRVQDINRLTVIASEGYADFVSGLQTEIKDSLYDRPTKINMNFFKGMTVGTGSGKHIVTETEASEIWRQLRNNGYVAMDGSVTDEFRKDAEAGTLKELDDELQSMTRSVYDALCAVYDDSVVASMIKNGGETEITENKLNANFDRKEFQTLWNSINHKYAYRVCFDSEELIEKASRAIDNELKVAELSYTVTQGEQTDGDTFRQAHGGDMFRETSKKTLTIKTATGGNVRYDLLGEIARRTKLTRKTVAAILTNIQTSTFLLYHTNPTEFISKASDLITEQKATMVVEHIQYNQIDGSYDSGIFTEEKHTDYSRAHKVTKCIQPYVFTDGYGKKSVEDVFVDNLDISEEVVVYAKLPRGFHIPTPVGNYSPDWAIAFKEGSVQHVFFVAETKGSMSTLQLREVENAKINCARHLFNTLPSGKIKYDVVKDYDTLMKAVKGNIA